MALGGASWLGAQAVEGQRLAQDALAGAIRRLRAGEPGAIASLMGICFAYGFFHAAGPGHGKVLIGGYGVARNVPLGRLAGLALASSLAQAATAVALVYGALMVLGWGRSDLQGAADGWLNQLSYAAIAGIGLWLMVRGLVRLHRQFGGPEPKAAVCTQCGHAHGPSIEDAANTTTLREALSIVAAVAVRPCTGALFLLVLTWQLNVAAAGIAGTIAIAIGTASVGLVVAVGAVTLRAGAITRLADLAGGQAGARVLAGVEAAAGAAIVAITLPIVLAAL